jgi:hypothetical protein
MKLTQSQFFPEQRSSALNRNEYRIWKMIKKFLECSTIWKPNSIASKTTSYTRNNLVSISSSARTSLQRCWSLRLWRESVPTRNAASQTSLETDCYLQVNMASHVSCTPLELMYVVPCIHQSCPLVYFLALHEIETRCLLMAWMGSNIMVLCCFLNTR